MGKALFVGIVLLFFSFTAFSQKAGFGLKAGLNFAVLSNSTYDSYHSTSYRKTPHFGLFGFFKLSDRFALQPELVYSAQGTIRNWGFVDNRIKLHYLNLPVLAKIYVSKNFHFDLGAQIGFLLAARLKGKIGFIQDSQGTRYITTDEDIKAAYTPTDLGLCIGFGYDLPKNFSVGTRLNYGLTSIDNNTDPLAVRERERIGPLSNKVFQFYAAYTLGKTSRNQAMPKPEK